MYMYIYRYIIHHIIHASIECCVCVCKLGENGKTTKDRRSSRSYIAVGHLLGGVVVHETRHLGDASVEGLAAPVPVVAEDVDVLVGGDLDDAAVAALVAVQELAGLGEGVAGEAEAAAALALSDDVLLDGAGLLGGADEVDGALLAVRDEAAAVALLLAVLVVGAGGALGEGLGRDRGGQGDKDGADETHFDGWVGFGEFRNRSFENVASREVLFFVFMLAREKRHEA